MDSILGNMKKIDGKARLHQQGSSGSASLKQVEQEHADRKARRARWAAIAAARRKSEVKDEGMSKRDLTLTLIGGQ